MGKNVIERVASDEEMDIVQEIARTNKKKEKEQQQEDIETRVDGADINKKQSVNTPVEAAPAGKKQPQKRNRDMDALPHRLIAKTRQQMREIAKEKLALTIERERLENEEMRRQIERMRAQKQTPVADAPVPKQPVAKKVVQRQPPKRQEASVDEEQYEDEEEEIVQPKPAVIAKKLPPLFSIPSLPRTVMPTAPAPKPQGPLHRPQHSMLSFAD